MSSPDEILNFWFGEPGSPEYGQPREVWFRSDPAFDDEIRTRFLPDYQEAIAGGLDSWKDHPQSCLALILMLDQFSRNLFREDSRAYAADSRALAAAEHAVARGFDRELLPVQRWFIYLPYEHSEDREMQRKSVALHRTLEGMPDCAEAIEYAERHQRVIERFGRFPHRNADLGRVSTPEEITFLAGPDAPF